MRRILLVGGGHAHLALLRGLIRRPLPDAEFLLVTPRPLTLYSGLLPAVIRREMSLRDAEIDVAALASRAGARLVIGAVAAIDPAARVALLRGGEVIGFDFASLDPGGMSAIEEDEIAAKPIGELTARIEAIEAGPPGTVAVRGGGPAAVELALALAQRWNFTRNVRLLAETLLPGAPDGARRALIAALGTIENSGPVVATIAAGRTLGPTWLARSGLACDESGCVRTDAARRSVSHPWVLAAGDAAVVDAEPRPKGGVWAVRAGPVLHATLAALLAGREPRAVVPQRTALTIIGLGHGRAVGWRGGLFFTGRLPLLLKRRLDAAWLRPLP